MRLNALAPWSLNDNQRLARSSGDPFASLQREMNQLLEGFFDEGPARFLNRTGGALAAPKLDVSETEKELHVSVELPGMKEDDIDVEFLGDALRIRGTKKDDREEKQHNFHRIERSFGVVERIVPIPVEVVRENVQATFKHGVLNIVMPKATAAQVSQKITVKPGE
jgi:HSP20 family protein